MIDIKQKVPSLFLRTGKGQIFENIWGVRHSVVCSPSYCVSVSTPFAALRKGPSTILLGLIYHSLAGFTQSLKFR
jgi:hypothetical protein